MHRWGFFWTGLITLSLAIVISSSCSRLPEITDQPYWPAQDWRHSLPEQQGMDSERLVQMFEYIEEHDIDLHSVLVVRNGYLVLEAYWHPYGPADVHTVQSITKTVIGALIGIAIDQGAIESVEETLLSFFPSNSVEKLDSWKVAISVEDLLSMTPGLDCSDIKALDGARRTKDWVQYFLDLPMLSEPGSEWFYCSGASHLLSAILQQSTGMDARTYANQFLFAPLGIPEVGERDWPTDPDGITDGIAALYLTPRDIAKFGYLYLQQGTWDQQQVLSSEWVNESTREHAYIGPDDYVGGRDRRFGYMWSIFPEQGYYGYLGMAGQEFYVLPQENVVVVFTGALHVDKEGDLLALIDDFILPSVVSESSIPMNEEANETLNSRLELAASPAGEETVIPKTALNISGVKYDLAPNFLGWSDMTFLFEPDSNTAFLRMTDSPDLIIGLDNRYRLTEVPDSRPVGLRGVWTTPDTFLLDYIIFGDFVHSEARIRFDEEVIKVNIDYKNWDTPPLLLSGKRE
jgi:CubicO group peptidase (beta-lactamase class C family)